MNIECYLIAQEGYLIAEEGVMSDARELKKNLMGEAKTAFDAGKKLFKDGRTDEARERFETALDKATEFKNGLNNLSPSAGSAFLSHLGSALQQALISAGIAFAIDRVARHLAYGYKAKAEDAVKQGNVNDYETNAGKAILTAVGGTFMRNSTIKGTPMRMAINAASGVDDGFRYARREGRKANANDFNLYLKALRTGADKFIRQCQNWIRRCDR